MILLAKMAKKRAEIEASVLDGIKIMQLRCQLGAKSHVGSEIDFTRAGYNFIYETTPTVAFKRKNINLTR